jgi:hypothetical protein
MGSLCRRAGSCGYRRGRSPREAKSGHDEARDAEQLRYVCKPSRRAESDRDKRIGGLMTVCCTPYGRLAKGPSPLSATAGDTTCCSMPFGHQQIVAVVTT